MRESVIEHAVCQFAEGRGWFVRKLAWPGRTSAPDRLMIRRGQVVFVEFKATGEVPRPDQVREHTRMRVKGATVLVIDSIEQGERLLA